MLAVCVVFLDVPGVAFAVRHPLLTPRIAVSHSFMICHPPGRVSTYALMATAVFQLLFAKSFAAVFASAFVTWTTSLTYAFCCAALGAGIVNSC